MGTPKLNVLIFLLCTVLYCVPAEALDARAQESRETLQALSSKVRFITLTNGLRVILHRRGDAPVFAGAVGVRVGGTDEQLGLTGISHMFEHMAFKGTDSIGTKDFAREKELLAELETIVRTHGPQLEFSAEVQQRWDAIHKELDAIWDRDRFVRELEKRGAADLNASTDKELTRYYMSLPRPAFEFWCWIESERLLNPVMREFYQERDVVKEEKRMRYDDDPGGKLYESMLAVSYLAHPYRNPVIGYDADLNRLTATAADEFRRKYYVPNNIVVAVVGDIDLEKDVATIEKYFGRVPAAPPPTRITIAEEPQVGQREFVIQAKAAPQLMIAYHKQQYPHPDDPPLSLMLEILAGNSSSPLYSELVKKRRIATGFAHEEAPGGAFPNLFLFLGTPRAPHTNQELLTAFDQVIERFLARKVTEEELQVAKRAIAIEYLGHLKSNLSLALDFVTSELIYSDWNAMLAWYDKAMAVTTKDVEDVAKRYLRKSIRTIGRLETAS